jgi:uncharacterized damage-inducible protein DinB
MAKTEMERIVRQLEKTFQGHPWHGPSITQTLEGLTELQSQQRIGKGHSILELVLHMIAWRTFVCERLEGNDVADVSEELNFPITGQWPQAWQQLQQSQQRLLTNVKNFLIEKLDELVPNRRYTYYTMLHGVLQHDIYHLGQIIYILKQEVKSNTSI